MIVKAAPKRRSGRGSFTDLRHYLEYDKDGKLRPDLVVSWSGHVMSHVSADLDMERIAALGQVGDPVYHVILSWRPHEEVSAEVARSSVDAVLRSLGAERHQWYAALHRDDVDGRTHLHMAVNRVNPVTLKVFPAWMDQPKLARASEWIEREFGCLVDRRMAWREYLPEVDLGFSITAAEQHVRQTITQGLHAEPPGAQQSEMDAVRRAGYSWATLLQREAVPAALAAVAADGATWNDLHTALETYHVHLERAGSGLRVVGHEPGQHIKASRVGLIFRDLQEKLGAYVESPKVSSDFNQRIELAQGVIKAARSWDELHAGLLEKQLAIEKRGNGGRVCDLGGSGRSVPLVRVGTSMPKLEKRLGNYELSEELRLQAEREAARRHAGIAERLATIAQEPGPLLDRITAHHAVWKALDVELEVARVVGAERTELRDRHEDGLENVREAVLARSQPIGVEERRRFNRDGKETIEKEPLYSTPEIIEQECLTFAAVSAVAERRRELTLRPASSELDDQQRAAYEHLADGTSDLKVATGIAGAGKSRLLRELCASYTEAGYEVIGTAVAGSAARVLGEEAWIPARTVARLLIDLDGGEKAPKQRLSAHSVIVLDEASMLGTADARRLFEHAQKAGARVLLLGDVQQHEAVARGPVLGEIVARHEACDLATTRRAQEQWLREVGMDLRAGRTTRAVDALRGRGCIAEHESTEEAMGALVGRYVDDVRAGRDALLIATRRAEVGRLNELVRDELRDGLGEEKTYVTAFGDRAFAIGDRVVTREPDRKTGTVNGDTWTVEGHGEGKQIALVRDRDAVRVVWDLHERPALDHGYATTSYRSQGRTVDGAYVLATAADAQRGLYVDVTRARRDVMIAYGRDELADFGRLLDIAARDRAKLTVSGVERAMTSLNEATPKPERREESLAVRDVYRRSETYTRSMRQQLREVADGEHVEGIVVWKRAVPESEKTLFLVNDGKGTYHRLALPGDGSEATVGQRVTVDDGKLRRVDDSSDDALKPVNGIAPLSDAARDIYKRSETFTQSMRQKLREVAEGERVEGMIVWKRAVPDNNTTLFLVNDDRGTYHRFALPGNGSEAALHQRVIVADRKLQRVESGMSDGLKNVSASKPSATDEPLSAVARDIYDRSETFTQSMRQQLHDVGEGERIEGTVAWKREIPGCGDTLLLIDDGRGTYHRCAVSGESAEMQIGQRVRLGEEKTKRPNEGGATLNAARNANVLVSNDGPRSDIAREMYKRSATFTQSMLQKLHDLAEGERIEGAVVWKRDLPEGGTLVLINDGQGTYHRCALRIEDTRIVIGQRIGLERGAGEEARLTQQSGEPGLRPRPKL